MTDEWRAVARTRAAAAAALAATTLVLAVAVVARAASPSPRPVIPKVTAQLRTVKAGAPSGQAFEPLHQVLAAAFLARRARARRLARWRAHERAVARARARARARRLARWRAHERAVAKARARTRARAAASRRRTSAVVSTATSGGYVVVGHLTVETTAYWPDPSWSNGYTATGMRAQYGVVAVDPSVIPLGTHLYVPGYGQAIAADTGGAIRGDHIDVCFNTASQAIAWGVQYLTVSIERPAN